MRSRRLIAYLLSCWPSNQIVLFPVEMKKQLSEQSARFDMRTEAKSFLLSEYSEYLRKRADLEFQYAKDLEKLGDKLERNLAKEAQVLNYFLAVGCCLLLCPLR